MVQAYLQAMLMILIAEMGDKTQILAMAFATKYRIKQIILGVAIGSFLNHGLAIVLGSLLTRVVPIDLLQLIAGLMFVGFAFWSLQVDAEEAEEENAKYGPILTVALAFFIGELGDKTQLTALTLGASSHYPLLILLGTVTGMVLTSMAGIYIGSKLGHKIPEMQLKIGAFGVFMFFGLEKLIRSPYAADVNWIYIGLGLLILAGMSYYRLRHFVGDMRFVQETSLQKQAEVLFNYVHRLKQEVETLCLGEESCEVCRGGGCTVGFMKEILDRASRGEVIEPYEISQINQLIERDFNLVLTRTILMNLNDYYEAYPEEYLENMMLTYLRQALERILFGEVLKESKDFLSYRARLIELDDTFKLTKL